MPKLLTLDEVGEITHRSVKGVREMIVRKRFPCSKVGAKLYVEESELRKFLRLSRRISAAEAVNGSRKEGV